MVAKDYLKASQRAQRPSLFLSPRRKISQPASKVPKIWGWPKNGSCEAPTKRSKRSNSIERRMDCQSWSPTDKSNFGFHHQRPQKNSHSLTPDEKKSWKRATFSFTVKWPRRRRRRKFSLPVGWTPSTLSSCLTPNFGRPYNFGCQTDGAARSGPVENEKSSKTKLS